MTDKDFDEAFHDEGETSDVTETETVIETEQVEEAPVEEVEQTEAPIADDLDDEEKRVPLAALIDTRMKFREEQRLREERERELQELRDQMARQQAPQQQPQSFPDPYDDPQGFAQYMQQQTYQAVMMERWNNSNIAAIAAHGEEAVNVARNWAAQHAQTDPAFEQEAMQQANPVDWLVKQHARHARLREFETDEEAFIRRRAAELGLISHSPMAAAPLAQSTQTAPKAAAPVSLATVSSNKVSQSLQNGKEALDAALTFKR